MAIHEPLFEQISAQIELLSVEERLRLIQQLAVGIEASMQPKQVRKMQYGQFHGPNMSKEEDFELAEWHPEPDEDDE